MKAFIKKIDKIKFGLMSPDDIRRMSVVTVEYPETYGDDGFPIDRGLMDPRLGIIDPSLVCSTCGSKGGVCQGHFGSIELARPIIHVGFGDVIHKMLRSTCNECGRILLTDEEIKEYTQKIMELNAQKESLSEILREIYTISNQEKCPHCGRIQDRIILNKPVSIIQSLNPLYDFRKVFFKCMSSESIKIGDIGYISREILEKKDYYFQNQLLINSNLIELLCEKLQNVDEIISILKTPYYNHLYDEEESFYYNGNYDASDKLSKSQLNYVFRKIIETNYLFEDYKLTASEVRERLEKISDEDSYVLGVNPEVARPEWLVLTVIPVPPVTVRPSIILDTGERSEDDLTHKLVDILRINQRLLENMEAGAPQLIVEDLWELLQYHVTTYFDNEASGVPPARHRSGRPLKTLTQRLKGKEGRFRSNLSGKRVNFSARTVISPDPNISINEVGVPEMIAKEVTVPVYVNEWNIDEMRTYIENGPDVHPGANYVINGDTKRRVTEDTKEFILEQLEPGFIIERHLKDGDMVLFNRQPSLHRMSMMAHEVRVLPYKTFRLNLCVCPPYNADFDGDEMNMHVIQSVEARAELKSMMRVQEHILSPRFGGAIIGAIHDHISGAFLLTRKGSEFSEEQALQIIRKSHLKIPEFKSDQWILKYDPEFGEESFIYKDKGEKWTGKELFSLLLPNDLNLSYKAEISKVNSKDKKFNDVGSDGFVIIENGILKQGVIDEFAFGSFSGRILDMIVKEYGSTRAKEFLDRATDLAICGIMKTGITTSLNDEELPQEAQEHIYNYLDSKIYEVDKLVESYEEGYLEALPGRSLAETLEMKIMQVLGEARDNAGEIANRYILGRDANNLFSTLGNNSAVMAKTGARASMLNLTQITACVGQQAVRGGRIERGYIGRTLPHFKKGELGAKAKGFVFSSYKSGLDPIEFFFHAMGGREGLVDTAIRTAQSGYMQRRLVNALQDLQVKPSGLVIDNQGNVIQTMFGDDGVDPAKSDFGKAANLDKLIDEIRMKNSRKPIINEPSPLDKLKKIESKVNDLLEDWKNLSNNLNSRKNEFNEFTFENNLDMIAIKINVEINSLKESLDFFDYEQLEMCYSKSKTSYGFLKSDFNQEIKRLDILKEEFDKKQIINKVNEFSKPIADIGEIVDIQFDELRLIKDDINNLIDEINDLEDNFNFSLQDNENKILSRLNSLLNDINVNEDKIEEIFSTIEVYFIDLKEYPTFTDEFYDKVDELDDKINNAQTYLSNNEELIVQLKNKFYEEWLNFNELSETLNNQEDSNQESDQTQLKKYDEIIKFNELLKAGIITQEEFDEIKRQIIFDNK